MSYLVFLTFGKIRVIFPNTFQVVNPMLYESTLRIEILKWGLLRNWAAYIS